MRRAAVEIGRSDDECSENRDSDTENLSSRWRLFQRDRRDRRDHHRLQVHERYRGSDGREMNRRIPRPEMQRKANSAKRREGELPCRKPLPIPPFTG